MIKKITDKDKEDWENFLNNKKKNLNKNPIKKKDIKNPDKDSCLYLDFVSEIITYINDKDKKIVSGDSEKIKTVYDTWVFSKDIKSSNPNWLLINTIT